MREAHFLCLRKPDCSAAVRCLGTRCCAFLTFSDMRFALASTSPGLAPARASHALTHLLMSSSWIAQTGLLKGWSYTESAPHLTLRTLCLMCLL